MMARGDGVGIAFVSTFVNIGEHERTREAAVTNVNGCDGNWSSIICAGSARFDF
jgi:hypothetical protein